MTTDRSASQTSNTAEGRIQADDAAPRVAYQGLAGAFSEDAVYRMWRGLATAKPERTFAAALESVIRADAQWAVLPIWNSTIGPITAALTALDEYEATLVRAAQIDVPVRHCLIAVHGTSIADVRYVGSHPAALAQCRRFFHATPHLSPCDAFDTAGAAQELSKLIATDPSGIGPTTDRANGQPAHSPWFAALSFDSPKQLAAIASASAARAYGMVVLQHDVQDDPTNVTRFVAVRTRESASC
jgi:prephenate dehydratase